MKIKAYQLIMTLVFQVLLFNPAITGELIQTVTFDLSQLEIDQLNSYDRLVLPGCELSFKAAEPQLPIKSLHLKLPSGAIVESIEVISTDMTLLEGSYSIIPVQQPRILSIRQDTEIPFTEPDAGIYNAPAPYPETLVEFTGQGRMRNISMANFIVYPLQYLPAEGQIKFYSEITFKVIYRNGHAVDQAQSVSDTYFKSLANRFCANSVALDSPQLPSSKTNTALDPGYYPYIIITREQYVANFQPLADWKTKKGVPAKIITTQWLIRNYSAGSSNIVRARNFLKDAVKEWGTLWVLVGGDTNIVPVQKCWAMNCQYGEFSENYIPCDLYISDLDCTWNANNNGVYGEVDDAVELYPDVFVGRAPADNGNEIDTFVRKLLVYEKAPDPDYVLRMLFAAEILWSTPYTNTGLGLDKIDELYVPDRFEITKLYEDLGNESPSSVISAINRGMNIINHDGHAWWSVMGVGNGSLRISDMDALTNAGKYSTLFSIGCWPAAIDYDCIAEHFVTNPNGGGVAFIGNSRYGWGSPGNPGLGYSDRYNETFFYYLFKENCYHIGEALAMAKAKYIPYARQENVYRWCMYQTNLLGDPEMPIWTDTPGNLTVTYPAVIPSDTTLITVTVTAAGAPVENARACLMNGDDVYRIESTDISGQARFTVATADPSNELDLTVTAQNFLPFETQMTFQSTAAFVAVEKAIINDQASAFIDSLANPGESIKLSINLKNYGSQTASSVQATLRSDDARIIIDDSAADFGDLAGSGSLFVPDAFSLTLDSSFANGDAVNLELVITAAETTWVDLIGLSVAAPVMRTTRLALLDSTTGNNNGYAEAGETVEAFCWIENSGLTLAHDLKVWAETSDEQISIINNPAFDSVSIALGRKSTIGTVFFKIEIAENIHGWPAPYFPVIEVHTQPANGPGSIDSLILVIGKTGLDEDMESGEGEWTHSGEHDLWHPDSARAHSGSFSWYCGDAGSHTYPPQMNGQLVSPEFYLAPNSVLSFWAWYDVALYSAWGYEGDGLHVEIKDDDQWEQLDFIGTGGALHPFLMGNDWLEYKYDLSGYEVGSQTQVRFRFISDNDTEPFEGAYVDDVFVGALELEKADPPDTTISSVPDVAVQPQNFALYQNYPNPFNPETTIRYSLPRNSSNVTLAIYNILGEKVRTLVDKPQAKGQYSQFWNGRDDNQKIVGSGVYFVALKADNFKQTRKMIFIR